jgi:thioredoxin reductase (NADPH)
LSNTYDVVILGGGITGLSAGIYSVRAGLSTLLIEQSIFGGQIINADVIENFPGFPQGIAGPDLIMAVQEQASNFGLEYTFGQTQSLEVQQRPMILRTDSDEFQANSIIICAGGERNMLGVPGEEEFEGRGVSNCATCDGYFFADQDVLVVGGGDSAIDEGLYLTQICSKVTVVHRRDELRASNVLQERAFKNSKMNFLYDSVVESINGGDAVSSIAVRNLKTNQSEEIAATGIFIYAGYHPNTLPFQGTIPMDDGGHIKVDLNMATEVPGVFAAGDCRWHSARQLATGSGDGVTAALSAYAYLGGPDQSG